MYWSVDGIWTVFHLSSVATPGHVLLYSPHDVGHFLNNYRTEKRGGKKRRCGGTCLFCAQ